MKENLFIPKTDAAKENKFLKEALFFYHEKRRCQGKTSLRSALVARALI